MPYNFENISCYFHPFSDSLPKFKTTDADTKQLIDKSYKVPANFEIWKILDYLYNNLGVKEHILDSNRDNQEATDHLSLGVKLPPGR